MDKAGYRMAHDAIDTEREIEEPAPFEMDIDGVPTKLFASNVMIAGMRPNGTTHDAAIMLSRQEGAMAGGLFHLMSAEEARDLSASLAIIADRMDGK